jgi:hypothetical protein
VYGDRTLPDLDSDRLPPGEARGPVRRPGSLETLSNFAAMALTAFPVDLTGVERGTKPSVGWLAGSGRGLRGEMRRDVSVSWLVDGFLPS